MTLDRFGDELYTGDVVVYADTDESGKATMDVYLVTELVDTFTCVGQLMSGVDAGTIQYLQDTIHRCAFVSESDPEEDEEGDEPFEQPTLN